MLVESNICILLVRGLSIDLEHWKLCYIGKSQHLLEMFGAVQQKPLSSFFFSLPLREVEETFHIGIRSEFASPFHVLSVCFVIVILMQLEFKSELVPPFESGFFEVRRFSELQKAQLGPQARCEPIYSAPLESAPRLSGLVWRLKVYPVRH